MATNHFVPADHGMMFNHGSSPITITLPQAPLADRVRYLINAPKGAVVMMEHQVLNTDPLLLMLMERVIGYEERALIAGLYDENGDERPRHDFNRQVYAEWLEEHGYTVARTLLGQGLTPPRVQPAMCEHCKIQPHRGQAEADRLCFPTYLCATCKADNWYWDGGWRRREVHP